MVYLGEGCNKEGMGVCHRKGPAWPRFCPGKNPHLGTNTVCIARMSNDKCMPDCKLLITDPMVRSGFLTPKEAIEAITGLD